MKDKVENHKVSMEILGLQPSVGLGLTKTQLFRNSTSNKYCSVYNCKSRTKIRSVSLHTFPKDMQLRKEWKIKLKIRKSVTDTMCICSRHFAAKDFFPTYPGIINQRPRLKKGSVPSRNLPQTTDNEDGEHTYTLKKREERQKRSIRRQDENQLPPPEYQQTQADTNAKLPFADSTDEAAKISIEDTPQTIVKAESELLENAECKTMDLAEDETSYRQAYKKDEGSTQRLLSYLKSRPHICAVCKKEFILEYSLKCHMCSIPDNQCLPEISNKDIATEPKMCEKPKLYFCDLCDKVFTRKQNLSIHVTSHHTIENHIACQFCSQYFSSLRYLKAHQQIHTDDKPLTCPFCGERFKWTLELNTHFRTHHNVVPPPKPNLYVCNLCHEEFSVGSQLAAHRKDHKKDKLLTCQYCRKIFLQDHELQGHIQDEHENAYILGM